MPKRALQHHIDNVAKTKKKPKFIANQSQLSSNLKEYTKENPRHDADVQDAEQCFRYAKLNQNNEIERLLLHTSKCLEFHVNHSYFPAFNVGLWPQENNEDFIDYPSCAFSAPYPIFASNNKCEKIDLCFKRPMSSEYFRKGLRHTRTTYQTTLKANKSLRNAAEDGFYHSAVFDLAERVFLQPDPFFSGSYDYYFTGGNLCSLSNNYSIIHAGGERLRNIMFSKFPVVENYADMSSLVNVSTRTTSENGEIFEISPLITSHDCSRKNNFIARQRNIISLNFLNEKNQIKAVTQFRTNSTPFISFAQSEHDINTFIVTTMKQHVRVYDLNHSVPTLVKLFEIKTKTPSISWNTTKAWRANTFLYANEKQFFLIDIRTSPKQWMDEVTLSFDSPICDHISAIMPSEFNNLFYVATNHKLQCMDIRFLKRRSLSESEGAVCRWSHQLLYAPLMIDTLRLQQTEYIALSSALPGDLHICQLNREKNKEEISISSTEAVTKHVYYSPCLAYQPPTLMEAYQSARLSGKCLNPEANLEARVKCCTTGLSFLKFSDDNTNAGIGSLLISNSNGDIFAHILNKREKNAIEIRCNTESDDKMAEFERKICEQNEPKLNYTDIKNMKCLRKVFLCENLSSVKKQNLDVMDDEFNDDEAPVNSRDTTTANPTQPMPKQNKKRLRLGRWQKPLSTLYSYKDALVPDILSIWDIDIEEEKYVRLGNLHLNIKTDPEAKVKDWLNTNMNPDPPMLTIPHKEISRYNSNNISNMIDNSNYISETQNTTIDFENAVHSTQIAAANSSHNISDAFNTSCIEMQIQNETKTTVVEKLKTKKKNKKYIKGF